MKNFNEGDFVVLTEEVNSISSLKGSVVLIDEIKGENKYHLCVNPFSTGREMSLNLIVGAEKLRSLTAKEEKMAADSFQVSIDRLNKTIEKQTKRRDALLERVHTQ